MSDEDNRNKVGDAGEVCRSGRHKGSKATRMDRHHWATDICDKESDYVSRWRERKNVRRQNRLDYEAGKDTPATQMMKERNIKFKKIRNKWKPTETIENKWVKRKTNTGTTEGLMPSNGSFNYYSSITNEE